MWLGLIALLPGLQAAPVGEPGQRVGVGFHTGLGAGLTAKFYVTPKVGVSAAIGTWALLLRRSSLLAEIDVYTMRFDQGTLVAIGALGVARETDYFWRGTKTWGIRAATGAYWRWEDRPMEVGTELGLELYNYNVREGQFGELFTATAVLRLYPGWGS